MSRKRLLRKDFDWSPDLAYAVGLITTDGNLSSDGRHITFVSTDKELIKTFKRCLGKDNKITINPKGGFSKKIAYRVQIGDIVLYDWLVKIGLSPNKSLTVGSINISDKYYPDFLRGLLDGDGTIIYYIDKYNVYKNPKYVYDRLLVFFLSASKVHIDWLQKNILRLTGLKGSVSESMSKYQSGKNSCFRLKFSTKAAKILLNWIYYEPGLPCLPRKFEIAKPFINS